MTHKTVYLPINVPSSDYCWDGESVCMYFDNTGGYGVCELNIQSPIFSNREGLYKKSKRCLKLKGTTND